MMGNPATRLRATIATIRVTGYFVAAVGLQTGVLFQLTAEPSNAGKAAIAVPLTAVSALLGIACWAVTKYLSRLLPPDPSRPHTFSEWMRHLSAADPYASPSPTVTVDEITQEERERRELAGRRAIPLTFAYVSGAFAICLAFATPTSPAVIASGAASAVCVAVAYGLILPQENKERSMFHGAAREPDAAFNEELGSGDNDDRPV